MTFFTVRQIREANEAVGHHWFEKDTMRFFRTRICDNGRVYKGKYFVTSEKSSFRDDTRLYSVRQVAEDGKVSTVEFQKYKTRQAAINAAKRLQ